jgi:membrane protease YdiL (CAAX protease family)
MHHFTNPRWIVRAGGWEQPHTATRFARYCGVLAEALADVAALVRQTHAFKPLELLVVYLPPLVIAACVLAPLGEELFFRGFMYASLRGRLPAFWAALVTAGLFGAVHPLFGATAWNLVPILAMAGFAMCLLYERTGSLWPAIGFHALMNIGVLYLVTGIVFLPLGIVGGAALLFLLAPWRLSPGSQRART